MTRAKRQKEDSPVEEQEKDGWEWADGIDDNDYPDKNGPPIKHKSFKHNGELFNVGDTVQIKSGEAIPWVALIIGLETDYEYCSRPKSDDDRSCYRAQLLYFSRQWNLNRYKKKDADEGEIYISEHHYCETLLSIDRHAKIYATQEEYEAHQRKQKRKFKGPDKEAVYFCPQAVNVKVGRFDFDWNEWYQGADTDYEGIIAYIQAQVKKKKEPRRRSTRKRAVNYTEEEFEDIPSTPRKRQKTTAKSTPKRKGTSAASTPRGSRVKKDLQITPLPIRTLSTSLLDSPYQLAQANLHVSAVPSSLPCREDEYAQILDYLEVAIDEGTGACIYISGVPGTGKTATVREVVRALNAQVEAQELDDFTFLEINGLKVLDPNQAYAMLWEAIKGERVTPAHAASLLDSHFKKAGPDRVPCVVLLDELDQLVMAKQTVLYNMFNWPTLPNSRLIVIAVANTMNLADMLPNKIQSRVGLTRVNFEPYNKEQLIRIIESRLENVPGNIVQFDGIQLCAARIANNTGDARKALDICRRAVEVAEAEAESKIPATPSKRAPADDSSIGKVTAEVVNKVIREFLRHPVQLTLRYLPFPAKLFLAALMLRTRRLAGKADVTFGDIIEEATRICLSSVNNPEAKVVMKGVTTPRGLEGAGVELEVCKIIDWEERGGRRGGRVGLQISEDDLTMAFQQDLGWKEMIK